MTQVQIIGRQIPQRVVFRMGSRTNLDKMMTYKHSVQPIVSKYFEQSQHFKESCMHLRYQISQFLDKLNYCLNSYRFSLIGPVKLQIPSVLHFVKHLSNRNLV